MRTRIFISAMLLVGTLSAMGLAGCGLQTEEASELVEEASELTIAADEKLNQALGHLSKASEHLAAGQLEERKASLAAARVLYEEAGNGIGEAKALIDEASSMEISDDYRDYLRAESRALAAAISLAQASKDLAVLYESDPGVVQPETITKARSLEEEIDKQLSLLVAAKEEADSIASENADEPDQPEVEAL